MKTNIPPNQSDNPVPEGKDFWQSKVFWINILSIIVNVGAYFGFDFKAHNIDPETFATIMTSIVGIINLYLRQSTNRPLNPIMVSIKKIKF